LTLDDPDVDDRENVEEIDNGKWMAIICICNLKIMVGKAIM
jgi:hypothetical protein